MDTTIEVFCEKISRLVEKFERDKHFYLSKQYLEAQARRDFIDPFFEALGWDIENKAGLSPFEREVILEKGETKGRPDYNFRIEGVSKFYVEAKAPSEPLDKTAHILQAKSYVWNTRDVFIVVLTDFEEFKVFDASLKPDPRNPNLGIIYDFKYTDYLEKLDDLWMLSPEEVASGSLDKLLLKDAQSKRLRIPVDKSFLSDMTGWREELAKDLYKRNPDINVRMLNEVVQRILDRFVFIRIAEDRKIVEPKSLLELVELWKREGKRKPLQYHLNILFRQINGDLNGEIFKHHACETYEFDSSLLAKIIEGLYFPKCPYRFDVIGVELLGSIYERYLGNTIRLTAKRVKVEEKPEVRKAGGVYYTPKYIVDYIADNTVGKLIEGKTPEKIAEIKILDPACGSGSFLLGAYQKLIDYHIKYYTGHPAEAGRSTLFPDLIIDPDGSHRLSITKKAEILQNNIFGVDIDPQAVEVSMMSLYIKALEGERTLPQNKELLPSLANNLKCGNSLIGYDFFEQQTLIEDEEREHINPFDCNSKKAGFGDIMEKGGFDCVIGNPPWGSLLTESEKEYLYHCYVNRRGEAESHLFFTERGFRLLNHSGILGFITPNTWLSVLNSREIRKYLLENATFYEICELSKYIFKEAPDIVPILIFLGKNGDRQPSCVVKRANVIRIHAGNFNDVFSINRIPQHIWQKTQGTVINLHLTRDVLQVIERCKANAITLSEICDVLYGIKTGNNKKYLSNTQSEKHKVKALKTGELVRYHIEWKGVYLWWCSELAGYRTSSLEVPKIIVQYIRKLSLPRRIMAALDEDGIYYPLNNYSYISPKDNSYSLKYVLGIINSELLNFYFASTFIDYNIKPTYLKQIPIRIVNFNNPKEKETHDKLVALVDRMLELNSKKNALPPSSERERIEREIAVTDERIDEIVYGLYGLTEEEIRVVESE